MSRRISMGWLVVGVIAAGAVAFSAHEWAETNRLREQIAAMRVASIRIEHLRLEHDRLQSLGARVPDEAERKALAATRDHLIADNTQTRTAIERVASQRAARTVPEPEEAAPERWTNAGQHSATASFHSVMWAATRGDWQQLARFVQLDADGLAEAQKFFHSIPADMQAEYGTPQALIAAVLAGKLPVAANDLQVVSELPQGQDEAAVRIETGERDRRTAVTLRFARDGEGWRLRVPAIVVAGYRYAITGSSEIGAPVATNP